MKKEIASLGFIICLILITETLFSQNTFEFTIKNPQVDEYIYDGTELADKSFLFTCNELIYPSQIKIHLVKLTPSGNLSGSVEITLNNQNSGCFKIVQLNPNVLVLAAYTLIDNRYNIWLYKMDTSFNEIDSKVMNFYPYSLYTMDAMKDESGNILCHGIVGDTNQHFYPFIYKISDTFDSLQFSIYTDHQTKFQTSLLRKCNYSGYLFFSTGYRSIWGNYNMAILDLNNTFSVNQINGVPKELSGYPNAKWIAYKDYILSGRQEYDDNPNDMCIGVYLMDTLNNLNDTLIIGTHDTIEWQALRKDLDFFDTNSVYIGGTHNFCQWEFCHTSCWFSLTNMDSLLNIRWEKFYGGNANYTLYGIQATRDGGCLLYGTIYDSTMYNERDIYVIKVDQEGALGGTDPNSKPETHDVIVYPNPGSDHLTIEAGPQIFGSQFKLISSEGKEIFSQNLNQRKLVLDVQSLPPGTFIWQIINQNKVLESGKWIKL